MKNNKKFMSVVAGVTIVSQLLPIGSVVAHAQTRTCIKVSNENRVKLYDNGIDVYANNGRDGFNIGFDTKNKKIYVKALDGCENRLFNKDNKDEVYLTLQLLDGSEEVVEGKGKVKKEVILKGGDPISKVVEDFNGIQFELYDGLRIRHAKGGSWVKISGKITYSPVSYKTGMNKDLLDRVTFIIGRNALEYREARH